MFGNKGYVGSRYSVRAAEAYSNDRVPLSHINKEKIKNLDLKYSMTVKFFKYMATRLSGSEWHHTGKYFNKTDFYDLEEIEFEINELSQEDFNKYKEDYDKEIKAEKEEKLKIEKTKEYQWVSVSWDEWVTKRKTETFESYGLMLNGWIHIYNYGKKKASGNYVTYKALDRNECDLPKVIQELLMHNTGVEELTPIKLKNRQNKASEYNYRIISNEELAKIEREKNKRKKELEVIERDKIDTSKIKRNNVMKQIIELELIAGVKIIKDKNIDRWENVFEAKRELERYQNIICSNQFKNWKSTLIERQLIADENGFDYYMENLKLTPRLMIDIEKAKKMFSDEVEKIKIAN